MIFFHFTKFLLLQTQRNIGCLLVCSDPAQTPIRLRGVLTDRDLVVRVIAVGFNADATRVWIFPRINLFHTRRNV